MPASLAVGYTAALIACLSLGSFGVPIKWPEVQSLDVHPLVFQSYKVIKQHLNCFENKTVFMIGARVYVCTYLREE